MILARVIENKTGKALREVFKERFVNRLNLKRTHLSGDKDIDSNLLTNSQNVDKYLSNDPKANVYGGLHGGAGINANTSDVMEVLTNLINGNFFKLNLSDFYTPNPSKNLRGLSGQAIIPVSYYESNLTPKIATGVQGSTRTTATAGKLNLIINNKEIPYIMSDAVFANPASTNPIDIINKEQEFKVEPGTFFRYFDNSDTYRVDIRKIADAYCMDNIMKAVYKFELQTAILHAYVKAYEPNYEIKMNKNI
jgi:CubicO group peptidase (beta-lactamase class C family)